MLHGLPTIADYGDGIDADCRMQEVLLELQDRFLILRQEALRGGGVHIV